MFWLIIVILFLAIGVMAIATRDKNFVDNPSAEKPEKPKTFIDKNGRLRDSKGRFVKAE